jgi:nitroreductase
MTFNRLSFRLKHAARIESEKKTGFQSREKEYSGMKAILERRSIRRYTEKEVPWEMIEQLLRAGMAAPSAGNQQPWHFIVVTDRNAILEIPKIQPYSEMLKEAGAHAIIVCGDLALEKHKGYWVQDCSAATQNILIAAKSLGLGAVWLGFHPVEDRVKGLRRLFGIPETVIPLCVISFGFPAEMKDPADRYDEARIHMNRW